MSPPLAIVLFGALSWASSTHAILGGFVLPDGFEQNTEGTGASANLVRATIGVEVESDREALVDALYRLQGGGALELLITWFPSQTLSELEVLVNGENTAARLAPTSSEAVRRLVLPTLPRRAVDEEAIASGTIAEAHVVRVTYRVRVPSEMRYRFPLAVPDIAAEGGRPVTIEVSLPGGARFTGDAFPNFTVEGQTGQAVGGVTGQGATRLRAEIAGVPSFVYVSFDASGAPGPNVAQRLELAAILAAVLFLAWGAYRWWRTTRPQA